MVHLFYFVLLTGNLLHCEAMKNRAAKLKDDVLSSGGESTWWDAFAHMNELEQYCQNFQGSQWLDVLDIFAHGRGMEGVVGSRTCTSFDIRLERVRHDLTTRRGTLMLLGLGMSLTHGALVTAAPPCSLSISISSSVHKRHLFGPLGDESNWKVRLSNRIVLNLVGFGANMVRLGSKWNGLVL